MHAPIRPSGPRSRAPTYQHDLDEITRTDDTDPLVCGGVAGCELEFLLCRVSVVFAEQRPQQVQQVQQTQFVATGDLLPQHRSHHDVLEIVIVDFPTASKQTVPGHVEHLLEPAMRSSVCQGGHRVGAGRRWSDGSSHISGGTVPP